MSCEEGSKGSASLGRRPKNRGVENRSGPGQKNGGVGQRDPTVKRGRDAENAVAADQRQFHRLSFRKTNRL